MTFSSFKKIFLFGALFSMSFAGIAKAVELKLSPQKVVILNDSLRTRIPIQVSYDGINWTSIMYSEPGRATEFMTSSLNRPNPKNELFLKYAKDDEGHMSEIYQVHGGDAVALRWDKLFHAKNIKIEKIASLQDAATDEISRAEAQLAAAKERASHLGVSESGSRSSQTGVQ